MTARKIPEVWVFSDGKAGHLNQSLGLAEALGRRRPALVLRELPARRGGAALLSAWLPAPRPRVSPALVIGAGHGTHAALLRWRRRGVTRSIVLMRPSLPPFLFDLIIEPRHDGGRESARRWLSVGPLNRLQPATQRDAQGVMLIGGPSSHYRWDGEALLAQLKTLCSDGREWQLSTSRRTPPDFLPRLRALALPGLQAFAVDELPAGWLSQRLPRAELCWVTPDSASMVYEALSAGCGVGLLELQPCPGSRVAAAIDGLERDGLCTRFSDVLQGRPPAPPPQPLAEADRLAARILERGWL